MSDDSNQDDTELDLDASESSEGDAGAASTTSDDTDNVNGEGEESATLKLDDSYKESTIEGTKSTAALNKQKQVDTWANRYYDGEVTLDEVPKWIQKEIQEAEKPNESVNDVVKRTLSEERANDKFTSMQIQLNKSGLKKSEVDKITLEYTELRELNVPKDIALAKAIKLAGVSLETKKDEDTEKSEKRRAMQTVRQGGGVKESSFKEDEPYSKSREKLSAQDRIEVLKNLRNRQIKI